MHILNRLGRSFTGLVRSTYPCTAGGTRSQIQIHGFGFSLGIWEIPIVPYLSCEITLEGINPSRALGRLWDPTVMLLMPVYIDRWTRI